MTVQTRTVTGPPPGVMRTPRSVDVELTAEDLQEIDDALSEITIQGDRYPKDLERQSGR